MSGHRGARQWDGTASSARAIIKWVTCAGGSARYADGLLWVDTSDGPRAASRSSWVVRRPDGEFRPMSPVSYAALYGDDPAAGLRTVYVSIGNSDDHLTQRLWHEFWTVTRRAVYAYADQVHGDWLSPASSPYQNACVCFEIPAPAADTLRAELRRVAGEFGQESIAWAETVTEFLTPPG